MISSVVLTKNSSKTLKDCLKSLSWCDEILVIDDDSTDNTLKIAKKFKARVYKRKLNRDFAAQRNFGLGKAKGDWVLFLDSDETITGPIIPDKRFGGYLIKRLDTWLGRQINHGETNVKLLRLAQKGNGSWHRRVHEHWHVKGKIGQANAAINHFPHSSVERFVADVGSYSVIHSAQNRAEDKSVRIIKVCFYPMIKFLNNYVLKLGFADGVHGFVIAVIMSFHSFLAWGDYWLTSRKRR